MSGFNKKDLLLVFWKNGKKYSIVKRDSLIDGRIRNECGRKLIGKDVELKWNRSIFLATIQNTGSSKDLKNALVHIEKATGTDAEPNGRHSVTQSTFRGRKRMTTVQTPEDSQTENGPAEKLKRNNIRADENGSILIQLECDRESVSVNSASDCDNHTVIGSYDIDTSQESFLSGLKEELELERGLHLEYKEKYFTTLKALEDLRAERQESEFIDIGHNVLMKKADVASLKKHSPNVNVFTRNIFRCVFQDHETVGRSLMGKVCNVNSATLSLPSVEASKRDAVIDFALVTFGVSTKQKEYGAVLNGVKKSLSLLILKTRKAAESAENELTASQISLDIFENTGYIEQQLESADDNPSD